MQILDSSNTFTFFIFIMHITYNYYTLTTEKKLVSNNPPFNQHLVKVRTL